MVKLLFYREMVIILESLIIEYYFIFWKNAINREMAINLEDLRIEVYLTINNNASL